MPDSLLEAISARISEVNGKEFRARDSSHQAGGCINTALRLTDGRHDWFVKTNHISKLSMFDAEAAGLNALADTDTLRAPQALCTGTHGHTSFIVMTFLRFGRGSAEAEQRAGEMLAAMHRSTADRFGWQQDNAIGSTRQPNTWQADWVEFWRNQRLGFQLDEAARNGHSGRLQTSGRELLQRFPALIDHAPVPSLLHGDLWGGNMSFTSDAEAVIFDPAVYYGDREADLAMTELFGGFSANFYAGYNNAWPLDAGYPVRRTLYNLYHILNHLNLFGGGYAGQAERMIDQLLAEC